MSSTLIVKAYYNDLNERQPEIRRFTLDISSDKDIYQILETTISQLNADYSQGQFILQYKDEDNDRITFSSSKELQSALKNYSTNGIIKIFVKPKSKNNAQSNENTTIHIGVICDGCQGPVVGNRYKCLECPDYDLCQTCSDKNLHSEHNMLKLVRPFRHRRHGCGPHFMRRHSKPFGLHVPWDINNFLSQFKGKEPAELIEGHVPEYLQTEKVKEMLNQLKSSERADKPIDETFLLENVGKIFREILSMLGINCDYSVDKQTEESKPKEKTEEAAAASNNTSTEPKPTVPPASNATSPTVPTVGNLIEQLQTMFAPIFQPRTTATSSDDQKKIDECIERVTSMGFVDSNGVLTELIKSKKGDLDQVLDALNPRNYKN